jgi:hypothetical protein
MEILITENQFRELSNILIEDKTLSPDEIYQKYYSKIKRDIFDKIIEADPKTIPGIKVGRYAKLLLNMFRNNKLPLEDLSKAKYYLKLVYKYNRSIPNTVQTLPEIYNIIEDKILNINSSIKEIFEKLDAGVDYEEIKGSDNWWVFIPKTEKGAAYLGVNTEWCTSNGQYCLNPDYQDRENRFDKYNSKANLYIIINKRDESEKYQFHFEDYQFKDKDDEDLKGWEQFLYTNKDLFGIFRKQILRNISEIEPNDYTVNFFEIPEENIVELKLKNFEEKGFRGFLNLYATNIKKIPEHWRTIYGNIGLGNCTSLKTIGKLERVDGFFNLYNCTSLTSLGKLKRVEGNSYLNGCTSLTSLENLQTVKGNLNLLNCKSLTSLGKLETVGGYLELRGCTSLTSLGKLQTVGGSLGLINCVKIESLSENLEVEGNIYIKNSGLSKYTEEELDEMYPKLKGKWKY